MSIKTSIFWAVLIAVVAPVAFIVIATAHHGFPDHVAAEPVRQINSVASKDPAFDMEIVPIGGVPDHDEQEIRLKARIFVKVPLADDLSFHWQLPESVHVVSGETEDSLANVKSGQIVELEISLLGLSRENRGRTVVLEVNSGAAGYRLSSSAIYSPTPDAVHGPEFTQE